MAASYRYFRCACCGQRAPLERLSEEGPFQLAEFIRSIGGKVKMSPEERMARKGRKDPRHFRGSGHGRIEWMEEGLSDEVIALWQKRLQEILRSSPRTAVGISRSAGARRRVAAPQPEAEPKAKPTLDIEALKSELTNVMNDDRKTDSIKKLKKKLAGVDEDKVDISDLEEKIDEYESIERTDKTPEEYRDEKQSAFDDIKESIDELELTEEE